MEKRDSLFILALFILTIALRLTLAFQTPHFTDDDSYFWKREAESIITTGQPFFHDPLSFGGRELSFSPLFAYILAFAGLFGNLAISGKIMLNIIGATTVIFVYLSSMHLTGSRHVASLTSLMSAIIPIWISTTVADLSPNSLVVPLLAILLYAYLRLESRQWMLTYLATLLILSFLHPASAVFVIGLIVYFLIARLEKVPLRKEEPEIILFSIFFVIWASMMQHKKAIMAHGVSFIWQNIPPGILNSYFTNVDILTTIASIGLVPFGAGIFIIYRYLLRKQSLHATLLISQTLAVGTLLSLRLLTPRVGYPYFGLFLCLLFSMGYQSFLSWLNETKYQFTHTFAPLAIFILIVATSFIPSLTLTRSAIITAGIEEHQESLVWMSTHTPPNTTIFADINEGQLIAAVANRRTLLDSNFLLVKDAETRYSDFETLLRTPILSTALQILSAYHIQYVYVSPTLRNKIPANARWLSNTDCFSPLYSKNITIYQVTCNLQKL